MDQCGDSGGFKSRSQAIPSLVLNYEKMPDGRNTIQYSRQEEIGVNQTREITICDDLPSSNPLVQESQFVFEGDGLDGIKSADESNYVLHILQQ